MKKFVLLLMCFGSLNLFAQNYTYDIQLEPVSVPELGGLQSYAVGTYNGEWLIIGGRLDGLHRRQPFAAFDEGGFNNQLIVVNPETKEIWKQAVSSLPTNLKEQLISTNMQFYQDGDYLLLTGGYAYSPSNDDHVTFPFLTVLEISTVIEEVKNNSVSAQSFKQIQDERYRVTGGRLNKIGDQYFLVGGQKFMGRYNPMGSDHGPGFIQEYSDEVRSFSLEIGDQIVASNWNTMHDEMHLHKRDYNLVPQIRNGEKELMAFSGVFQHTADVPWLYPVSINENSYEAIESFTQHFNHYHCATLPIYNTQNDEMHSIFFGGIAQFYEDDEILVQDNDIPFVNTIADVVRLKDGSLIEKKYTLEMPGLIGAASEFILSDNNEVPLHSEGIIDGDLLTKDPIKIGYIYGGIRSTAPNIFWDNEGSLSEASSTIYEVRIARSDLTKTDDHSVEEDKLLIYPNPAQKYVRMAVVLSELDDIKVSIYDVLGELIHTKSIDKSELSLGSNYLVFDKVNIDYGAYIYKIQIGDQILTRKVIWSE